MIATPDSTVKRCAFTGYRPQKMPFGFDEEDPMCQAFKRRLNDIIEELIGQGYAHFLSGGALGMDMFAAEAVLDHKEQYPWITLEMVIPFDAQAEKWAAPYQARHKALLENADIVTRISREYTRRCIFARNRYLVDNADLLLAAYDGQSGGTEMTVNYARSKNVQIQIIDPAHPTD